MLFRSCWGYCVSDLPVRVNPLCYTCSPLWTEEANPKSESFATPDAESSRLDAVRETFIQLTCLS